ncbi:protein FAM171B-like isoform X1 [Oreochromis aureus]|uniref:Family with sequence similarity 171 member B n=2 Tax=Oreochromis aureus TaxID=47969 RepID=A0AAZ1XJ98_OREAU|nr:protein FAM171B-like isoform X1 [Oreochromis aureus]XP_039455547.1 protein FAM171B-like isoform X1 [Oreochromis aureus]
MRLLLCVSLLCSLVLCSRGRAEFTPAAGHPLHADDGNFSKQDPRKQEPFQLQQQVLEPRPGSTFSLKVQVNDVLSRQYLSQAVVELYVNYTKTNTALSGEDGGVLFHVPYHTGMLLTVVACQDGYICTLLPCKTDKMPIFSSVTLSLQGLNQGNIWLFEDSVLITGRTSDASSQPVVSFPKTLLNLTHSNNITSVKAFLTIPRLTSEQGGFLDTRGIMSSKSGYVSVELSPVAAVSVQLFSGDTELHVTGPVQMNLNIPDSFRLQSSSVIPAWFFNRTTGGWMRKGLGKVASVDGRLMWTFTAPHLGYWIAAPVSSNRGFFELAIPIDFIIRHSFFLMVLFGGTLVIIISLLVGLCYCRCSSGETKAAKILPVMTKDQNTSTCDDDLFEVSSGKASHSQDQQPEEKGDSRHNASFIANTNAVAIMLENDLNTDPNDLTCSHKASEQRVSVSLTDNLFFYNQPVAILHTPAFFHLEEQPEQAQWSKSATLPRAGASNGAATEPLSKENLTQTQTKGPPETQNQAAETEDKLGASGGSQTATPTNTSRLPESVSVPGTLHKILDSRHSVHGQSNISSLQPPRAWFVSLEGKPAAEIHYAVTEQQRRRRPVESRETSLDSGVDMSELNQTSGRRAVTLERNATFVKSASSSKHTSAQ